ncbi:hypothetical protein Dimus_028962 [Dionaea muscipula]
MLCNRMLCKVLSQCRPRFTSYVCSIDPYLASGAPLIFHTFCTFIESPRMSDEASDVVESSELPSWVEFCENENSANIDSEDEFVLPKIADWADAQKPYDPIKYMEPYMSDSDVESLSRVLNHSFESPNIVMDVLSAYPVDLSETVIKKILNRFGNDWIPALGFFKWANAHKGYQHTADCYNMMVDILGKSRKFELMWECIEEMKQFPGFISIVTMSKVIRRLSRAGRWNDAVEALRNMEQLGLNKDSEAMNIAMDALVKGNCVEQAHLVFFEFKEKLHPNLSTFNILIHGWCKARQLDKASLIMGEMEKYGFHPDMVSYTSFIEAYCKEKDFQKVYAILDDMQKNGCPPNTLTYTIIMLALGKAKEMTKALEIYEKVRQNGCHLDSPFYSALIFILNKSGRFTDAVVVFEDMSNQDVTPNVLTYNTMIAAACMHSREEDALQLLIDMKKKSCKPNLKTYAPLLKMCCAKKRMKVLNYLLNDMFREDVSLDAGTYTLLVNALCKSGKLEHACAFLKQMVLKGMVPMGNTHKSVIKKLEEKGMSRAKQQIENLMLRAKVL